MKKNRINLFVVLTVIVVLLVGIVFGGYMIIDRILVPKYFSAFGINNLSELIEIVDAIYTIPNEEDFIDEPFTDSDSKSATKILVNAGFPTLSTGEIDYERIGNYDYTLTPPQPVVDNFIVLTNKEVAAIMDEILESGILVSNFPELSYIDTLEMEVKQLIISPLGENEKLSPTDAKLIMTIKLDTLSARKQISENLEVPQFLIDFIIPDTIYMTASFDTFINDNGIRSFDNGTLAINSKTAKQSEVIMNLLLSFIYSSDEMMSIEDLTHQIGMLVTEGLDVLGTFEFVEINEKNNHNNGVKIYLNYAESVEQN